MKWTSLYLQAPAFCSLHYQVLTTGIISSFLVTDNSWNMVMQKAQLWLAENKWDIKVSTQ